MPTYEYKCKECKRSFEVFQSIKDEPLSVCPECGGFVRRVLSGGAGVIFKGQGFYVTDKGKVAAHGVSGESKQNVPPQKEATATASSNTTNTTSAATPCSTCQTASGTSCAARTNDAT
jgi:putative FmdB family regulatory protein